MGSRADPAHPERVPTIFLLPPLTDQGPQCWDCPIGPESRGRVVCPVGTVGWGLGASDCRPGRGGAGPRPQLPRARPGPLWTQVRAEESDHSPAPSWKSTVRGARPPETPRTSVTPPVPLGFGLLRKIKEPGPTSLGPCCPLRGSTRLLPGKLGEASPGPGQREPDWSVAPTGHQGVSGSPTSQVLQGERVDALRLQCPELKDGSDMQGVHGDSGDMQDDHGDHSDSQGHHRGDGDTQGHHGGASGWEAQAPW